MGLGVIRKDCKGCKNYDSWLSIYIFGYLLKRSENMFTKRFV